MSGGVVNNMLAPEARLIRCDGCDGPQGLPRSARSWFRCLTLLVVLEGMRGRRVFCFGGFMPALTGFFLLVSRV